MSEFIIASISDADKFIQYDKLGKMCITNRREKAARFSDSGKAWRILTTQMSKKKRDGWKVIAYESETSKNKEAVSNSAPRFKASKTDLWETPQDFFDRLNDEFHFNVDVCATPDNAKCGTYFTKENDGLSQSWGGYTCWCNPPYGREIGKWVQKAYLSSRDGSTVVMLLPARTDTKWFHE